MPSLFRKPSEQTSEATVSSIPVPPADSALVIDLPEGQKLVLGKMDEGTVIEVATWRGTGRPDSRTNRLMLGVSFGGAAETVNQSEENSINDLSLPQKIKFRLRSAIVSVSPHLKEIFRKAVGITITKLKSINFRKKSTKNEDGSVLLSPQINSSLEDDIDIDKWLETVRSRSRVSQLSKGQEEESLSRDRTQIKPGAKKRASMKHSSKRTVGKSRSTKKKLGKTVR